MQEMRFECSRLGCDSMKVDSIRVAFWTSMLICFWYDCSILRIYRESVRSVDVIQNSLTDEASSRRGWHMVRSIAHMVVPRLTHVRIYQDTWIWDDTTQKWCVVFIRFLHFECITKSTGKPWHDHSKLLATTLSHFPELGYCMVLWSAFACDLLWSRIYIYIYMEAEKATCIELTPSL